MAALYLVILIALPFSAPFKTFDLADAHSSSSPDSLPKDQVDSSDDVLGQPEEFLAPPDLTIVVIAPSTRSSQLAEHPFSPTVLRL
jgi:hypothetical protein